ncbi:MAG: ABC transporter ATP-binding protein [Treponema phagedenis]|uniref:ABC transporter ATP-binding protein n=1 Tax=Treponema phagedenis TaxID=162 RepID=A0A7H8VSK8_TREPH|nr:ABC transporter ATP-binding protein [Treponema phagedenis]NVP24384.1 ABC transporter ATP-binding protein [Treponema phagedenis]NVP25614.1 ABC transporter ATP-binding protein [Treponema phagedenis]QEJ96082.1 ABC transporter ATP-binding protein [Treponema phagedenis]QEJ99019.1 ABC transporter ATP-binding protein [Treponema phagedenis]QEK01845.1 ABC transporter ATP-binding protein [Treponema phagedenis]
MKEALLSLKDIRKTFDSRVILDDISFDVFENDCIVLAGANGAGKTVLMTILSGLETEFSGTVKKNADTKIGLVFQSADAQILGDTVFDDCAFGLLNCGFSKAQIKQMVEQTLQSVELFEKKDLPARSLSGGEKRKLAVASILVLHCDLIIFDEPFANLDYKGVCQTVQLILQLKAEGKTLIIITHETEKILAASNRFLVLANGKIIFDDTPQNAFSKLDFEKAGLRNPLQGTPAFEDLLWK